MSHIDGQRDADLHHEDGSHRSTPTSTDGSGLERFERRMAAHMSTHGQGQARSHEYHEYQVWQHRQSGDKYAVRLRPYVEASQRGVMAGSLEDEQYEAGLIDGVCGPLTCSGEPALTEASLKSGGDLHYWTQDADWVRERHTEFRLVEAMSSDVCLICGELH